MGPANEVEAMKLSFAWTVLHPAAMKGQIYDAVAYLSIKTEDVQKKTNEAFVKHVCVHKITCLLAYLFPLSNRILTDRWTNGLAGRPTNRRAYPLDLI